MPHTSGSTLAVTTAAQRAHAAVPGCCAQLAAAVRHVLAMDPGFYAFLHGDVAGSQDSQPDQSQASLEFCGEPGRSAATQESAWIAVPECWSPCTARSRSPSIPPLVESETEDDMPPGMPTGQAEEWPEEPADLASQIATLATPLRNRGRSLEPAATPGRRSRVHKRRRIPVKRAPTHSDPEFEHPAAATTLQASVSAVPADPPAADDWHAKEMQKFKAFKKTFSRRNYWVALWIRTRPKGWFDEHSKYQKQRLEGFEAWKKRTNEEVVEDVGRWLLQVGCPRGRGAPPGNQNSQKVEQRELRAPGVIATWHVEPCDDILFKLVFREVQQVDPETLEYDELMDQMRALPAVRRSWEAFLAFLEDLKEKSWFVEQSSAMELCLHGGEPRWHFHLVLSNLKGMKKSGKDGAGVLVNKDHLEELAPHPLVHLCSARGRAAEMAIARLHCYPQWPKIGQLFSLTTYPRVTEFVCKASWTLSMWQMRKMSYRHTRAELINNRDAVEASIQKLDGVKTAEIETYMRQKKQEAQQKALKLLKPPKKYPAVDEWRQQYRPELFGLETRFKFLVLVGESRWGKTRFACSLWGLKRTFVSQCQGVTQPCLTGYDPRMYDAIVLDEPDQKLVSHCKVLLQASLEGTELYQSPTQRFTRWVWLYQVPIIICTNKWIRDDDEGDIAKWIRENQVCVEVNDYMYERG